MVYISQGNRRMSVPTFSLPAEKTCPGSTHLCRKYCYSKKAEKAWKNVLPCRMNNMYESNSNKFVDNVVKIIKKRKPKYFRIHESGDFYSQDYLDKWFEIIEKCPEVTFLAYTQCYNMNFSHKPDNLNLYWTVWPDSKDVPKEGLYAYVVDNGKGKIPKYKTKPTGFNCSKGMGSKVKCENCKHCLEGKGNVIFKIH